MQYIKNLKEPHMTTSKHRSWLREKMKLGSKTFILRHYLADRGNRDLLIYAGILDFMYMDC